MNRPNQNTTENYNSIITLFFIIILIIIRIAINNYQKQNIVVAWINFISIFYVLWRIHHQINHFFKERIKNSIVLENQYKRFKNFSNIIIFILFTLMIIYTLVLVYSNKFYLFGSCINDILSLCALLFSIEDETVINKIIEHYRYSI